MKTFLKTLKEDDTGIDFMYIDRSFEFLGHCDPKPYYCGPEVMDEVSTMFRPALYEKLSEVGRSLIDSKMRGEISYQPLPNQTTFFNKIYTENQKAILKDNEYMMSVCNMPMFEVQKIGQMKGYAVNDEAVNKIGFPLGYALEHNLAEPLDYAKADTLYEMKPVEEQIAERVEKVAEVVGLRKGFETHVAENLIRHQYVLGESSDRVDGDFEKTFQAHKRECEEETWVMPGVGGFYESLLLFDKYESDIVKVQNQMLKEGRRPYDTSVTDPDALKDIQVRNAYGFVISKIEECQKEIGQELKNVLPYRKKNYGVAKQIFIEYNAREKERTME